MRQRGLIVLIGLAAVALVIATAVSMGTRKENSMPTYVITETPKYSSLDPLDGDSSQNLPVVRMLYATPVEILADNSLGSRLLESFSYDQASRTVEWHVRRDITFSDGSPITADDIAFAVARMTFSRPKFPLIKLIRGVDKWLAGPEPLKNYPEGIKVSGNKVTIELTEDYPHPLFRFCLEIFSVIPKQVVDPSTNKIASSNVPTSGYYEIIETTADSIQFKKRAGIQDIQGKQYADKIQFLYRDPKSALSDTSILRDDTVILSSEALFTKGELAEAGKKFNLGFTPASWFTILQINPDIPPFQDPHCRHVFAEAFRKNFEALSETRAEASIFTKMVPGYKTHDELAGSASIHSDARSACLDRLSSAKISVGFGANTPKIFVDAIRATAKELGLELGADLKFADRKQEVEAFLTGKSAFLYNRTGFWAMDPTGDIQMLFTPNLHKVLEHFWTDDRLQGYLRDVVKDGVVNSDAVDGVNAYLFTNSKLNVYSHIRRFYASKNKELVQHLSIGITNASPWQIFGAQ